MSTTAFNYTPTSMITNHNEHCTAVLVNSNERTNVNDVRREKGEREGDVKRTRELNEGNHSTTSITNKQYNCPNIDNSMANSFSSSFTRNNFSFSPIQRPTSSSRKTHYLDDSDEEIILDEILEITYFDRHPTLIEWWGEDNNTRIRHEGDLKIEEYVQMEELEPTITEEISYEYTYDGDQIKSTREIYRFRSQSRNFRKLRKRRIKRKRSAPTSENLRLFEQSTEALSKAIRTVNIDLIDENEPAAWNFESKDQVEKFFQPLEGEIHPSHVSSDHINSRRKSSINESDEKHGKTSEKDVSLNSTDSETTREKTIEIPDRTASTKDQLQSSAIDEESSSLIETESSRLDQINNETKVNSDEQESSPIDNIQPEDSAVVQDIPTTSLPVDLSSTDSILETIPLTSMPTAKQNQVQYTNDDEKHSISITTESEQTPALEETTVSSDFPTTLIDIHLPSNQIKPEELNAEKSGSNWPTEVDKQPESISTSSVITITPEEDKNQQTNLSQNESITSNSINRIAETTLSEKQKRTISSETKEDEHVELSSDFLVDIVRQMITVAPTTRLPSINQAEESSEKTAGNGVTSTRTVNVVDDEQFDSNEIFQRTTTEDSSSNVLINTIPLSLQSISPISYFPSSTPDISVQTSSKSFTDDDPAHQSELTLSEIGFSDLYQNHYFTPIEIEQLDEKKTTPDLTQIYYELHEQRRITPVLDNLPSEHKQEASDSNLPNHIGQCDITSFSMTTNLPSSEYRQVFGAADEIISIADDLADRVDQTVQSNMSSETPQVKDTFSEDHADEVAPAITSNAEIDLRYSLLLDRMNTLLKPLIDLPSFLSATETESIPSIMEEKLDASNVIDSTPIDTNGTANDEVSIETDVSPIGDQLSSTTQSTESNEEIFTPIVADEKAAVSKSSEENTAEVEDNEQDTTSSLPTDSSNVVGHIKSFVSTILSSFTGILPTPESIEETSTNIDSKVPASVTQSPVVISEELETKEVDDQQPSLSSTRLLDIVKNIVSSTLLPNTPTETSSEGSEVVVTSEQQNDSVGNLRDHMNLSSTDANQQTTLQASTTTAEESPGLVDSVVIAISNIKETISHLGTADEKPTVSINVTDDSNNSTEQLEDLVAIKVQPADIDTEEQVIHTPKQPITPSYPWYVSQSKVAATESDPLAANQQSPIIDHQQENTKQLEPSDQELQMIHDDYPWYSSYYSIVDAEAKLARLYKQLNLSNEQLSRPTIVESQEKSSEKVTIQNNDLQGEEETEDDGFLVVQRRKRIPSATTHEMTVSAVGGKMKSALSPDIDLEPVVLHGHSDTPIAISSIVPQETEPTPKKKHKKKKKDRKEMILFNAPEPTPSHISVRTHSPTAEEEEPPQATIQSGDSAIIDPTSKYEEEQLRFIPVMISDDQTSEGLSELVQSDDRSNELASPKISATLPKDVQVDAQLIKEQPKADERTISFSPSSEEEDIEGFQLVHYRGRRPFAAKSEQTPSSPCTSNEISNLDVNQETPVPREHQHVPKSKKKRKKHKKQKKEVDHISSIDSSIIEQEPIDEGTNLRSDDVLPSISEDESVQLPVTVSTTAIHSKSPASLKKEEDEEDNEGFRVVTYHKRMTSASRFMNTPPSSPQTKTRNERNMNRNTDQKRIVFHGRHESASPSFPHSNIHSKTTSNNNTPIQLKQNNKQTASLNTAPRSASVETQISTSTDAAGNRFRILQETKWKIEQSSPTKLNEDLHHVKSSIDEPTIDSKPKLDQSPLKEQPAKLIVEEHPVPTEAETEAIDQPSSIEKTTSSSTPDLKLVLPQGITRKKKPKKPKANKGDLRSLLTTDIDSISLSVEETIDRKIESDIQQAVELPATYTNISTNSEEIPLVNTASEMMTSPIEESVDGASDAQSQMHSIQSMASTTSATEETSKPFNDRFDDHSITNQTETKEPTMNVDEESVRTPSNKNRRKKKSRTKEKPEEENVFHSPTNTATSTVPKSASNLLQSEDIQSKSSPTKSGATSLVNGSSIISSVSMNNKLDLFLPDYMREQINTRETSPLLLTSSATSSDTVPKKKTRSKMLQKDLEAKSLLTNEFDTINHSEEQPTQQTTFLDDKHINDDDDFIIQSTSSTSPDRFKEKFSNHSTEQTAEDILSRGFYLWLQESQALSQRNDTRTNIIQNLVIQPSNEDDDEDSWNGSNNSKSTYMLDVHPNKRIHTSNAYSINHPESLSTPSWLIDQSNENTFQDKPGKFDPKTEDDFTKDHSEKLTATPSNSTTFNISQENLSRQMKHNFDDWAYFFEDKTTDHIDDDLSTSLECFYTRALDEDTLLSETLPIHRSMKNERQRYGDFLPSNNDESTVILPTYKSKPSEYFQNRRQQESASNIQEPIDDELLISHSSDGLSRRVRR